jgi:hypothetical protein
MRRIEWAVLAVLLTSCVAGCAARPEPARAPAEAPPPEPGTVLPLDGYRSSPEEQERSDRAQLALERRCLDRFGLQWVGPGQQVLQAGRRIAESTRAERFGLVDAEQAASYGYHPPPWSLHSEAAVRSSASDHDEEAPADVRQVLYGQAQSVNGVPVPAGGCRAEAAHRLTEGTDGRADLSLLTSLPARADREAAKDARAAELVGRWNACLRRAGYDYASPAAASQDARWSGRQATAVEIAVATADVRCKDEVDYLPALVQVTAEHQRLLIAEHAAALDQLTRLKEIRASNVARVLEGEAPVSPSPTGR